MPDFSHSLDQLHIEQSQSQQAHFGFQSQHQGQITISCDPPCHHGSCVGENECNCRDGWSGSLCDECKCSFRQISICFSNLVLLWKFCRKVTFMLLSLFMMSLVCTVDKEQKTKIRRTRHLLAFGKILIPHS